MWPPAWTFFLVRAAADVARRDALAAVKVAIKAAHGKVPLKEAAGLAQVSRVTAYKMLEQ